MCEQDATTYFERFLGRIAARWRIEGVTSPEAPRRKLLPLGPIGRTYGDRVVALGDAAGVVKGTTGGGIYYSVVTASLAARVVTASLAQDTLSAESLGEYERLWRARLGPEIDVQLQLRELAHRMDDDDIDGLFELARVDGIMPIVRRTARFNQHRTLILALFRHPPFRRLLLDRLLGSGSTAH
jgi:flavin-dependent dehydrogenase